uniref:Ig-like domain-containing protein n=2 Tax=Anabas testudineus TaxID=64144 RepID=A0A7N6BKG9_ANATE
MRQFDPSQPPCHLAEMILFWITLLLHQGDALISVTTVQLGDPVTFKCFFPDAEYSNTRVKWYKQSTGDTLTLITTLMKATTDPVFEKGFSHSRFHVNHTQTKSTLTILTTVESDEAIYHCAVSTWSKDQWSGSYLDLKENSKRRSRYTVIQWPTVSDPVRPGDSVALQCSVFSVIKNKTCPGDHSVYWFRAGSDESHSNIIYTGGNDECEKRSDSVKSCVHRFSKNVSSSDAGTYYCAVATCGEIVFGQGTKLDIQETSLSPGIFGVLQDNIILLLLCAVLVITLVSTSLFVYATKENKCDCCNATVSLQRNVAKANLKRDKDTWIYSTAVFTMLKTGSGGMRDPKAVDRERIYAAVKAFGLN